MRSIFLLACLASVVACSESSAPVTATSIAHHSAVTQSGTVAQQVGTRPSVRLLDASNQPAAGVSVSWTVTAGNGSVGSPSSKTNSDGVAVVTSWTLGTTAGANRLRASTSTLTGIDFEADAAAGAPVSATIHAGNAQAALVGQVLPIDPAVKVVDQYGNAKAGVAVVFAVTGGGGMLTGASQNTGIDGVATLGSWRLGATPGAQTLSASISSLGPVQVTATASVSATCDLFVDYTLFTPVSNSLVDTDCLLPNTFYHDFYQATLATTQSIRFQMQSTAVDPFIMMLDVNGNIIAHDDDSGGPGSLNSLLTFIAGPGPLLFVATTAESFQLGSYSMSTTADDGQATSCELLFALRGISSSQNLTASDCFNAGGPFYSDEFVVRLIAGIPVTIGMSSATFDTYLELYGTGLAPLAANDNISAVNLNSQIVFTPAVTNYYVISASSFLQEDTGPYTLTISPAVGGSLMAPESFEGVLVRMGQFKRK